MENRDKETQLFLEYVLNSEEVKYNVTRFFRSIDPGMANITNGVIALLNELREPALRLYSQLQLSLEKKDAFRSASEQWGKMGWTYPPSAGISLFYTFPDDPNEADTIASAWSRAEDMEELFSLLKEKGVHQDDMEEAIFLFHNEKYKSCALILFSMIDAVLIHCQSTELTKNGNIKRRKTGYSGAKEILEKTDEKVHFEKLPIVLSYFNLMACLKKIFESGEDFRVQPDILNRNFVVHGMLTRKVIRKDCIQLFLLYYNLLSFLNIFGVEEKVLPINDASAPPLHLLSDKESGHA